MSYKQILIDERNRQMKELEEEFEDLEEISRSLYEMIYDQGEFISELDKTLDNIVEDVDNAAENLEKALKTKPQIIFQNIAIVAGSAGIGVLGFLAGPVVGIATTVSGIMTGIGVVTVKKKLNI